MAGNPFDNPKMSIMYRDALQSLYAGAVMPWDREILAIAPLPADVVDPFASQDVDPLQIMGFAYNSLVTWIDEAKKANYFSKRFTDLSKLVLKGVMTMGRGLITLHNRGEDLSRAPMQIGDLISVGSYHFRKSYLGVIQTAKSHPEISERLLLNQLSWMNMLLRLYKTKEKLAKPVSGVRDQVSKLNSECGIRNSELPSDADRKTLPNEDILTSDHLSPATDNSSLLPLNSSLDLDEDVHAFSDVDALFEPAALSAPRALTAMRNAGCGVRSNAECGIRNAEEKVSGASSNEEGRTAAKKKSETSENKKSEIRNKKSDSVARIEEQGTRLNAEPEENKKPESGFRDQVSGVRDSGTRIEDQGSRLNKEGKALPNEEGRIQKEGLPDGNSDNSSFLLHNSSLDNALPPYLQILRNAFGRSEPNEEGRVTFTFDEIRYLAADPDFARIYPETASDMQKILQQIDTG